MKFSFVLILMMSVLVFESSRADEQNKREGNYIFGCFWKICSRPLKYRGMPTTTPTLPTKSSESNIYEVLLRKFIKNYSAHGYKVDGIESNQFE